MFDRLNSYRERVLLDDEELQQEIVARLEDDPAYLRGRRLRVTVDVDAGAVTVRGSVRTALERRKVDIVARALGAVTVDNQISLDEQGSPPRPIRHGR